MANTGFMLESRLTPDQRSLMGMIYDSVELMTHIVNDVLDLSRLEAGRMSFERIPVNIVQRCENVLRNLETQSKPKKVKSIPQAFSFCTFLHHERPDED